MIQSIRIYAGTAVFKDYESSHPDSEWYFANVYADDGVTPLGWWES